MEKSKFIKGQKVKYLPKLSGFNNNKKLTIRNVYYLETDSLHSALNIPFTPTWCYSFENSSLSAIESDLTSC